MKKMMFNDRYGLTEAVLQGRKTVTRRLVNVNVNARLIEYHGDKLWYELDGEQIIAEAPYKVGEIVAVAQRYEYLFSVKELHKLGVLHKKTSRNKMFVKSELMPHQIRILNIIAEKLQDITDDDCLKEGVHKYTKDGNVFKYDLDDGFEMFNWFDMPRNPRETFAYLIGKVSGKGTWASNPYVWRIEFELIK